MNISDEAVEAAARQMQEDYRGANWDELTSYARSCWTAKARAALEAAAPHIAPSVDASAVIAELRLFNHHEAAALIERLTSR